jgi:hypothetical protein
VSRNALRVRECPVCGLEAKYWRTDRSETGRLRRKDSIFHSDRCKMRAYRFRRRFLQEIAEGMNENAARYAPLLPMLNWSPRDPRWIPLYWLEFGLW